MRGRQTKRLAEALLVLVLLAPAITVTSLALHTNTSQTNLSESQSIFLTPDSHPLTGLDFLHPNENAILANRAGPLTRTYAQWAVGGYSTSLGLSSYSAVWSNLASSYSLTGVSFAAIELNVGFNATGVPPSNCPPNYVVYGELFQAVLVYISGNPHSIPSFEVLYMIKPVGGGPTLICAGQTYESGANWGSSLASPVTQTIAYTTFEGFQGWWYSILLNNGSTVYLAGTAGSSISSTQTGEGDTLDPSIALEVNETTSGNFLSDNSLLDIEANVGGQSFVNYGIPSTPGFNIGLDNPPTSAYGSGVTVTPGTSNSVSYDEFGTLDGINLWMQSSYLLSNPTKTQNGNTNLPALNFTPILSLSLSSTTISAGSSVNGRAALSHVTSTAGGTVTYYYYSGATCSGTATQVGSPVTVTNGLVPNSASLQFNTVGTYSWRAVYSGDSNNLGTASGCVKLTVNKASPSLSTVLQPSGIPIGGSTHDTATLTGGSGTAGGTLTYYYSTSNTCPAGNPTTVNTVTVTNGIVPNSNTVTFNTGGEYYWYAIYSGDSNNNGATSPCEPFAVGYYLTMKVNGIGSTTPASGYYAAGSQVTINAFQTCHQGISKGSSFTSWTGSGPGSYTGQNNPATITMNGAITETANFVYGFCPQAPPPGNNAMMPLSGLMIFAGLVASSWYNLKVHGKSGRAVLQ